MTKSDTKTEKKSLDIWFYSLSLANGAVLFVTALLVLLRTKTSDVKVPVRLIAGNEFVQGRWWNVYLILAIMLGLLVIAFIYSNRLSRLNPFYKNTVLVLGLCLQIFGMATLYRVAGLSALV